MDIHIWLRFSRYFMFHLDHMFTQLHLSIMFCNTPHLSTASKHASLCDEEEACIVPAPVQLGKRGLMTLFETFWINFDENAVA